jgi:hypothetical protein
VREAVALLAQPRQPEDAEVDQSRRSAAQLKAALTDPITCTEVILALDGDALENLLDTIHGAIAPRTPSWAPPKGEELDYTIDGLVLGMVKPMHKARQRVEAYGARSLTDLGWLRDALNSLADDLAVVIAGVADMRELEGTRSHEDDDGHP